MAGSSARRARRLSARNESGVTDTSGAENGGTDRDPGPDEGGEAAPGKPAPRRLLNRTAARRPGSARPDAGARGTGAGSDPPTTAVTASTTAPASTPATASAPAPATSPASDRAPLVSRIAASIDQRGDDPRKVASSVRMQGNEMTLGFAVAAVLVVVPVVFLTVTTGKGAVAHPPTVAPAIGVILALAMAATLRLNNRILTAFLAVTSTLATTSVGNAVPTAVRPLSTVDLVAALVFAMWITLRQSKARNAALAERRKADRAAGGTTGQGGRGGRQSAGRSTGGRPAGRRGRKASEAEELTGPPPSARYTPPKKRS